MKMLRMALAVVLAASSIGLWAAGPVVDLKTHLDEAVAAAPLKYGAMWYLKDDGISVMEIGEDWAVWIEDVQKTVNGDSVSVTCVLKLTAPTAFQEKTALRTWNVSFSYRPGEAEQYSVDDSATRFLRKKIERWSAESAIEGKIGGKAVADAIASMVASMKH